MKMKLILAAVAAALVLSSLSQGAVTKDRTAFDCRETVKIHKYQVGPKRWAVKFVKACPHRDKLAEGKCVTTIWGQMRCTE